MKRGGSIGVESFDVDGTSTTDFCLIDFDLLCNFLQDVAVCKKCSKGEIIVEEAIDRRSGLASCINVACSECDALNVFETSRRTADKVFEVNHVCPLHLRRKSSNWSHLCAVLNLPSPPTKFVSYNARLLEATNLLSK
ncbi:unnamed protein product [Ixodes persulcatus]